MMEELILIGWEEQPPFVKYNYNQFKESFPDLSRRVILKLKEKRKKITEYNYIEVKYKNSEFWITKNQYNDTI